MDELKVKVFRWIRSCTLGSCTVNCLEVLHKTERLLPGGLGLEPDREVCKCAKEE